MKRFYVKCLSTLPLAAVMLLGCSQSDSLNDGDELVEESASGAVSRNDDGVEALADGFTGAPEVPKDMEVVFEDDFTSTDGVPDPDKWVLCEKTSSTWARYLSGSYDQAYTKDGYLYLIGERKDGEYLTGAIESRGKFTFEHGRVECRAKFAEMPQGGHTGIWMMPAPPAEQWPKSGEIDIMEHLNKEDKVYQTVHTWYADDLDHKDPAPQGTAEIDKEDWNIYGVEWTSEKITFTVNGKEYMSYPNLGLDGEDGAYQWPFNHPFYLILSQSLGGEGTWAGPIDDSELPAVFQIDWIRVMQTTSGTNSVPKVRL